MSSARIGNYGEVREAPTVSSGILLELYLNKAEIYPLDIRKLHGVIQSAVGKGVKVKVRLMFKNESEVGLKVALSSVDRFTDPWLNNFGIAMSMKLSLFKDRCLRSMPTPPSRSGRRRGRRRADHKFAIT